MGLIIFTSETIRHAITTLMGGQTHAARQWANSGNEFQDKTIDEIVFQVEKRYEIMIDYR